MRTKAAVQMNRSAGRVVHIFTASDRKTEIGGLKVTTGLTNENLHSMIEMWIIFDGSYTISNESGVVPRDFTPLQNGNYYIDSTDDFRITDEGTLFRAPSRDRGRAVRNFREAVRSRDMGCAVTRKKNRSFYSNWSGFEVAHIFPLAHYKYWADNDYDRWVTIPPGNGESINSVQNGILLRTDIHQHFNSYLVSINPHDNYKIVDFGSVLPSSEAWTHLSKQFLDKPERPPYEIFAWHFRQAVLANMKGPGEPVLEHNFPPGSDMVGEILSAPKAAERMEFELFGRLAAHRGYRTIL